MIASRTIRSCFLSLALLSMSMVGTGATGSAEMAFLNTLAGGWSGNGRVATTRGEAVITCDVNGNMHGERLSLRADCSTQGQSGSLGMSLYHSEMSRQFHGQLLSPLRFVSGSLNGSLSRGDLFLRLAADDGSEGRLLFVEEGPNRLRLLVTTVVDGSAVTILDLPLLRRS